MRGRHWAWKCGCWVIDTADDWVRVVAVCARHRQAAAHVLYLSLGEPELVAEPPVKGFSQLAEDA